ncbi:indolepyruvate ferredoxin oxidoreductase beta subunit [Desulfonispora thiosulfatigenes DSM 11270]|uniref:Indolepyruvate ferredoxin oxidoreductase beta subunit n=1 Tax=Desulfonispora thiosulfatigenes DSM 11270 TaxID=656914 RepID=A0A1W1VIU4_DESTI|nr:indolepyruvate oxidoreductase subunit beta [Desulfonispora thiosulfatigenes]SMB93248.1 indolepyruvate ferredoxin oxidoreductase beta subunit [Desulfonispora thiosulfatigenes DSM 11270]
MNNITNILIVGVGGQGTILASRVLSRVAQSLGQDVKVSEIHGMAQRGGSVVTQVRFGSEVASPIIQKGQADIILAFERLEGLRWLPYLKKEGKIIVNDQRIDPMPVISGNAIYPENIAEKIESRANKLILVDALEKATLSGNAKAVNVVLLGVLSKILEIDHEIWLDVLKNTVPPKFLEANINAFEAGRNY